MKELTYRQALVEAVREEMNRDPEVLLMGQDVGIRGGTGGSTKGLWQDFADTGRIIDTPISEMAVVGSAVGLAMKGMRPIVEMGVAEFLPTAMTQIVHDAANIWCHTLGKACASIVIRIKFGFGFVGKYGEHASSIESWFAHVPGLRVVMPTTPYDAKGLLKAAIRDDNPVLFFEHISLYNDLDKNIPETDYILPLDKANIRNEGDDVTLIASGAMVKKALKVADIYRSKNISIEVIDLRSLSPLDKDTILGSVVKTGRLVIVQEAWKECSISSEVSAIVAENAFYALKAPIVRVGAPNIPIPYSPPLFEMFIPNEEKILDAVKKVTQS
jgi:pyruvate dehydrogenase E1 component beta subunit